LALLFLVALFHGFLRLVFLSKIRQVNPAAAQGATLPV
jgi:hypothetical protein